MVSKSRIRGTRTEGLSGLEVLLALVGLEVTTEGITTSTGTRKDGGTEFQISGAAMLKQRVPYGVDKWNREKISVGESERKSGMTGMQ